MDDLETRELRYFVTVAEELHFGRAAQRLNMAQPPLSRAIARVERRLGVALFDRSARTIRLTPAGQVLLRDGRRALDAVATAARRARRAAAPRLVLTMKPGGDSGLLQAILAEYERQPDAVGVDIAFSIGERAAMLRDGRADVGFLHRPQNDLDGLDTEDLRTERQVVLLASGHPLAQRTAIRMADLRGEPMPRWPESVDRGPGLPVQDSAQLMQLVALGRAVAVVPESVTGQLHDGLVCRPVLDAPTATLVVAWPQLSTSRQVAAFVTAARIGAASAS